VVGHTRMCRGYMYMLGVRTHVIVDLCVHEYIAYAYVYMCVYTYIYLYESGYLYMCMNIYVCMCVRGGRGIRASNGIKNVCGSRASMTAFGPCSWAERRPDKHVRISHQHHDFRPMFLGRKTARQTRPQPPRPCFRRRFNTPPPPSLATRPEKRGRFSAQLLRPDSVPGIQADFV